MVVNEVIILVNDGNLFYLSILATTTFHSNPFPDHSADLNSKK